MAKQTIDPELVYLDSTKLRRLVIEHGLSDGRLNELLNKSYDDQRIPRHERNVMSRNTQDKAFRGEGVRRDVAKFIADFFQCKVSDLVDPRDPSFEPPTTMISGAEWELSLIHI